MPWFTIALFCLALIGCQQAPTPIPPITPEQMATPAPTESEDTDTETPTTSLNPDEVVGSYTCQTLTFKPAGTLALKEDGTYQFGAMVGTYARETDVKLTWTSGEIGTQYERTSPFFFTYDPPAITLNALGTDRQLDLVCKRDATPTTPPEP